MSELRIKEAKQLLISSEAYTIETIGYDCDFNSKATFFTTFKKITGTTSAKYKKKKRVKRKPIKSLYLHSSSTDL
ncbi:AraC family transcriptional regulator [Aquimarina sp. AD10]|uniref:helix-turn-helix domain-containing protein n=1 Tax=Aquimarina sp. AD10 TaxID=1714849 RepID=UPI000E540248|nr:AraC family transcriptional regulator [Aquimarina sp. AD10]RKN02268.1 helix-turn-helix domain-containing protein [Aquimarina sp. AD10]